MPDAVAIRKKK